MRVIGQTCSYCSNVAVGSYIYPGEKAPTFYCGECQSVAVAGLGHWKITPQTRKRIETVQDTGRLSYGSYSREFEVLMARTHACNYAVVSNSGTSSLQVALQALKELHGWSDGDEVIVPASTFVATLNIVLHNRMTPVLVDVEPNYYAIDPELVEAAITSKTRCIIPVHPYGQPADMLPIMDIVERYNLKVIEDSCEAMFVDCHGGMVGSFGDIGVFSTYMAHLVTTGVGGISVTDNEDLYVLMRSLVNHGRSPIYTNIDDDRNDTTIEMLKNRFKFERIGHSFRVTEFEAALGIEQIENRLEWLRNRQQIALAYTNTIRDGLRHLYQPPSVREGCSHAFMVYPIVWLGDSDKWQLCQYLERAGIETREMLPLVNQPAYNYNPDGYPVAKWLLEKGFYIGCHQHMTPEQVLRIQDALRTFYP